SRLPWHWCVAEHLHLPPSAVANASTSRYPMDLPSLSVSDVGHQPIRNGKLRHHPIGTRSHRRSDTIAHSTDRTHWPLSCTAGHVPHISHVHQWLRTRSPHPPVPSAVQATRAIAPVPGRAWHRHPHC